MLRPKLIINKLGVSVQLWRGPWPHTVITFERYLRPRLRVYRWRGRIVR